MPDTIELKNINYPPYLENISFALELREGQIISLFGYDKNALTALLRILSGLDNPESGEIIYNQKSSMPAFPFIPKLPSSFPWLTVKENIEVVPDRKIDIKNVIEFVGLTGYEDYYPDSQSIGFRFRISLARALSLKPSLILLDACIESMDDETKKEIITLLKIISSEQKVTFLYASSVLNDIMRLGDVSAERYILSGENINNLQKLLKDINAG